MWEECLSNVLLFLASCKYHLHAFITPGLYTFYLFLSSFMYCDLWPYIWLVFKSGFKSRAGYIGRGTVSTFLSIFSLCGIFFWRIEPKWNILFYPLDTQNAKKQKLKCWFFSKQQQLYFIQIVSKKPK